MYSQFMVPNSDITAVRMSARRRLRLTARVTAGDVLNQAHADAVIAALDGGQLGPIAVLEYVIFMGQHLHRIVASQRVFHVVVHENAKPLLRIALPAEASRAGDQ